MSLPQPGENGRVIDDGWVRVAAGDETWEVDAGFLASDWTCIWGRGCLGIGEEVDPTHHLGCCSLGAELSDEADAANVAAVAACLDEDLWQHARAARDGGVFTDEARRATRVVDGACIFLNRPGFAGGAGCALHLGAMAHDEPAHEWKPNVCWQLPLRIENRTETDGTPVTVLRRWSRADFGDDGEHMAWFCTDTPDALVGDRPVVDSLADELVELVGDEAAAAITDAVRQYDRPPC